MTSILYDPPGFLNLLMHFIKVFGFLFLFIAISLNLGLCIFKFIDHKNALNKTEKLIASFALGIAFLGIYSLILGTLGYLLKENIRFSITVLAFSSFTILRSNYLNLLKHRFSKPNLQNSIFLAASLIPLSLLSSYCLLPTLDWDDASYQLPLAYEFLNSGYIKSYPHFAPYNFPAFAQTIYVYFLAFDLEEGCRLINLVFTLGLLATTYCLGKRLLDKRHAILAVASLIASNILWEIGTTSKVDNLVGFYLLWFILLAHIGSKQKNFKIFSLAYLLAGIAISTKYTGLFFAVPIGIYYFSVLNPDTRYRIKLLAICSTLFLIPSSYWYLKNLSQFHAILYPISISSSGIGRYQPKITLNGQTHDINQIIENQHQSLNAPYEVEDENLSKKLSHFLGLKQSSKQPKLYELNKLIKTPELFSRNPYHYIFLPLLLGILAPLFLLKYNNELSILTILSVLTMLALSGFIYLFRYFIPVLPVLALSLSALVLLITKRIESRRMNILTYILLLFSLYIPTKYSYLKHTLQNSSLYLSGKESQLSRIQKYGYNRTSKNLAFVLNEANLKLPENSKILMVGETKGLLLNKKYRGDYEQLGRYAYSWSYFIALSSIQPKTIIELLKEEQFTHILINWSYLNWSFKQGGVKNQNRLKDSIKNLVETIDKNHLKTQTFNEYDLVGID